MQQQEKFLTNTVM